LILGVMELAANLKLPDRLDRLVDWLYPPRCRACAERIHGPDREYFCAPCWLQIQLVSHPLCRVCGRPFPDASGDDHTCGVCLERAPRFAAARAWACYPREASAQHALRQVVQKYKYGRKVSLGRPLGRLMARGCEEFLRECHADLIVPVPLHAKRLRWRGFNQALLLAREVGLICRLPVDPFVLQRQKETVAQTKLSEGDRRRNVRGAFALRPDKSVKDLTVLVVDDVYTSGATVNECSRTLKRAGAKEAYVLTLARAVY